MGRGVPKTICQIWISSCSQQESYITYIAGPRSMLSVVDWVPGGGVGAGNNLTAIQFAIISG